MKVTPLDIRQQQFPLRFRGFDPAAVDTFLELVASEVEEVIKENIRLKDALAKKEQELQRIREGEDDLKRALTTIQQIKEDWVGRAEKQAEQVAAEAHLKARQILLEAEKKLVSLQGEVQGLERQRRQLVFQLRGLLEQHLKLLQAEAEESEGVGER